MLLGILKATFDYARGGSYPEFTMGGNNAAEIATPTREFVFTLETLSATPMPEGIAATAPARSATMVPRDSISNVMRGSSFAASELLGFNYTCRNEFRFNLLMRMPHILLQ